jgi:hypothetical protein
VAADLDEAADGLEGEGLGGVRAPDSEVLRQADCQPVLLQRSNISLADVVAQPHDQPHAHVREQINVEQGAVLHAEVSFSISIHPGAVVWDS